MGLTSQRQSKAAKTVHPHKLDPKIRLNPHKLNPKDSHNHPSSTRDRPQLSPKPPATENTLPLPGFLANYVADGFQCGGLKPLLYQGSVFGVGFGLKLLNSRFRVPVYPKLALN